MSVPNVWSKVDLDHILKRYGTFIVVCTLSIMFENLHNITDTIQERSGTDLDDALTSLEEYKDNIYVIEQLVQNDVSSTKIRMFVKRGSSPKYAKKNQFAPADMHSLENSS